MLLRDIQRSAEEQQAAAQDMKARRRAVSRASVVRCLLCCRVLERVPGSWVRCVCSDAQVLLIMRCHPKLHQLLELEEKQLAEHANCDSCPSDVRACHLRSGLPCCPPCSARRRWSSSRGGRWVRAGWWSWGR